MLHPVRLHGHDVRRVSLDAVCREAVRVKGLHGGEVEPLRTRRHFLEQIIAVGVAVQRPQTHRSHAFPVSIGKGRAVCSRHAGGETDDLCAPDIYLIDIVGGVAGKAVFHRRADGEVGNGKAAPLVGGQVGEHHLHGILSGILRQVCEAGESLVLLVVEVVVDTLVPIVRLEHEHIALVRRVLVTVSLEVGRRAVKRILGAVRIVKLGNEHLAVRLEFAQYGMTLGKYGVDMARRCIVIVKLVPRLVVEI